MDNKEKQDLENILNRSRQIQVAEINERKNEKDKVSFKKDLLEINNETNKETEKLTKSKTKNISLKCNLL
ncbi:hypothetical protein [Spiroplasma endosymbiont of Polydrusus pterygomalis]|uniref:hypothetical protein n=1 Tax=Spiroplasma endosymbiont of Polydrusus pterygomalis TaxID=3139327 RepID=UPI003CCAF89E